MKVLINDIEYVPKIEALLTQGSLRECLRALTKIRHCSSRIPYHLASDAIKALSPEFAELDAKVAYDLLHEEEQ